MPSFSNRQCFSFSNLDIQPQFSYSETKTGSVSSRPLIMWQWLQCGTFQRQSCLVSSVALLFPGRDSSVVFLLKHVPGKSKQLKSRLFVWRERRRRGRSRSRRRSRSSNSSMTHQGLIQNSIFCFSLADNGTQFFSSLHACLQSAGEEAACVA